MSLNQPNISMADTTKPSGDIQIILSKSYTLFFFCFVLGLIVDVLTQLRINLPNIENIGLIISVIATGLIYWAQTVNKAPKYLPNGERNFRMGPYAFSRHPTYLSIFLLMVGAALLMNSYSILAASFVAYIVAIFTFMAKEEKRHIKKYGEAYLKYMKRVGRVL